MKKILVVVFLFLFTLTIGCGKEEKTPINNPQNKPKDSFVVFGTIRASEIKNIMLNFPAVVEKVHIKEGQRVKAGDLLITLNINELKSEIESKQKEISVAKLELLRTKNDSELHKVSNSLKYERELYLQAERDFKTAQTLYSAGAINKTEFDEDQISLDNAKKRFEELKISYRSIEKERVYNIKIQNDKIAALQFELKILTDKLNQSYLKSNVIVSDTPRGIVCDIGYLSGDIVDPEKKVLSIINLDSIFVQADVAEEFIKDVKPGSQVTIVPIADKSKKYQGKVATISDKAIQKNGETIIPVDILIEQKDDFLIPDFNVDVSIKLQ